MKEEEEEEGFFSGEESFFDRGRGGILDRLEPSRFATKKKTFHDPMCGGTFCATEQLNSCVVFKNAALPGAAASTLPGERGARNSSRRS